MKRFDYCLDQIDWSDAILTAGGDGTFLMAASKVEGHSKPVIGINTDPERYVESLAYVLQASRAGTPKTTN